LQKKFDAIWNAGAATPGLTLGVLAIASLFGARLVLGKLAPGSGLATFSRSLTGRGGIATLAALALAGEALSAHLAHRKTRQAIAEAELEHDIHYTVYQEYGDPPMPSRPEGPPSLASVYYRGNDERNPALFNGGHYRTTTFHLDLCDAGGTPRDHGDAAAADDLFLRVQFERAPGTPDYFWLPERMAAIYATRDAGKFQGRFDAVDDAVAMSEIESLQRWEFRYPLSGFARGQSGSTIRGIVYLCEQRTDDDGQTVGGRFHYAFQFDLSFRSSGRLTTESDLWMGALYRKRSLRIWEIPGREWLSTEPIPVVEGAQSTTDPKLLGIEAYEKHLN
jgi:hypothetical protein